jgi:hypothetical protein
MLSHIELNKKNLEVMSMLVVADCSAKPTTSKLFLFELEDALPTSQALNCQYLYYKTHYISRQI